MNRESLSRAIATYFDGKEVINFERLKLIETYDALDVWFAGERATLNTLINTTSDPFSFTLSQKKKIFKSWLEDKFRKEEV